MHTYLISFAGLAFFVAATWPFLCALYRVRFVIYGPFSLFTYGISSFLYRICLQIFLSPPYTYLHSIQRHFICLTAFVLFFTARNLSTNMSDMQHQGKTNKLCPASSRCVRAPWIGHIKIANKYGKNCRKKVPDEQMQSIYVLQTNSWPVFFSVAR